MAEPAEPTNDDLNLPSVIEEADDLHAGFVPKPPDEDSERMLLTPEQRKVYLGKLAEFEILLGSLTEMQANFALAVLRDPTNLTEAARVAGFRHPNIDHQRLIKKPKIAAVLALGEQLRQDRTLITTDRTLHEFAIVAFSDITDFSVDHKGNVKVRDGVPEYHTRAISSVDFDTETWTDDEGTVHQRTKTKIRLWSKTDALRMIALYQKLLNADAGSNTTMIDNSKHVHVHQHNTWQWGNDKITF
jgi:phage terminase small subunit